MSSDTNIPPSNSSNYPLFGEAKLRDLFEPLTAYRRFVLAVSGGADSTALMLLVRRWQHFTRFPPSNVIVLTVDHGLRQDSASEAAWVADQAARLGFQHQTLVWQGTKPKTGLQAAAREARYDLLAEFCREHSMAAMVTAHTSNDQAETVMMRLARGSGLDGLSAMAAVTSWDGIDLIRPLLGVSGADLETFLKQEGQDWISDPSNRDESYERIRIRKAMQAAKKLGISQEKLILSTRRLGRARKALDAATASFLKANLTVHEAGFGEISISAILTAPEELALRSLARIILAFGGHQGFLQLSKIEAAYAKLTQGRQAFTLGGCEFVSHNGSLVVFREYGRMDHVETTVSMGQKVLWDKRFSVRLTGTKMEDLKLRPLGADGQAKIKHAGGLFGSMPRAAIVTLPSLWKNNKLCYVPFTRFQAAPPRGWLAGATAQFINSPILFDNIIGRPE